MNSYDIVLEYIKNEIYFRIKPSPIHGVGLFAIKDISQGTNITVEIEKMANIVDINKFDLVDIHPNVVKLLDDYCVSDNNCYKFYFPINYKWMHHWFINHSDNPNFDPSTGLTTKDIKEGEEIYEDYQILDKMYKDINNFK